MDIIKTIEGLLARAADNALKRDNAAFLQEAKALGIKGEQAAVAFLQQKIAAAAATDPELAPFVPEINAGISAIAASLVPKAGGEEKAILLAVEAWLAKTAKADGV